MLTKKEKRRISIFVAVFIVVVSWTTIVFGLTKNVFF
jgi:hypothetical protein